MNRCTEEKSVATIAEAAEGREAQVAGVRAARRRTKHKIAATIAEAAEGCEAQVAGVGPRDN